MSEYAIEAKGVGKEFNGVWVLRNIDFKLKKGEVHALVGENGAGKSTFIKMLSGVYQTSEGSFQMDDTTVTFPDVEHSEALGIRTVHQEINLVPYFTVFENIFIGSEVTRQIGPLRIMDDEYMRRRATEAMQSMGVNCDVNCTVASLNATMQKIVQICSVLVYDPKVIIFDEPTAALGESERNTLLAIIKKLKEKGLSIIYISHNLEEIEEMADRVTVFRNGEKVGLLERGAICLDQIIPLMLGDKTYNSYQREISYARDEVMLEVKNITTEKLKEVSFAVHKGEVVGIAGVVGAGKTEIANVIFGLEKPHSGSVFMQGEKLKNNPENAIESGIALVPEERRVQGVIPDFPVFQNVTLTYINRWVKHGSICQRDEVESTNQYIQKLCIKTQGAHQLMKYLSGGNQQKAILSRWLIGNFSLGLFDEPTKGIDIKAKEDIYELMDHLVQEGKSILMMSSYLPELLFNCDRILVMREGRLVGDFKTNGADLELQITKVMLGGNTQ